MSQNGTTVPFTLSILESASEEWLTPGDWKTLVRAVLSSGDHLILKSEYLENCKEMARRNAQAGNAWSFDALVGEGQFASSDDQMQYDPCLFVQIQSAAVKAWCKLPVKGDPGASLTAVRQGPNE